MLEILKISIFALLLISRGQEKHIEDYKKLFWSTMRDCCRVGKGGDIPVPSNLFTDQNNPCACVGSICHSDLGTLGQ